MVVYCLTCHFFALVKYFKAAYLHPRGFCGPHALQICRGSQCLSITFSYLSSVGHIPIALHLLPFHSAADQFLYWPARLLTSVLSGFWPQPISNTRIKSSVLERMIKTLCVASYPTKKIHHFVRNKSILTKRCSTQ